MEPKFRKCVGQAPATCRATIPLGVQAIYGGGVGSVQPLLPEPNPITLLVIGSGAGFKAIRDKKVISRLTC